MKISAQRAIAIEAPRRSSAGAAERADLVVRVDYQTVDEFFSEFARNINEGGLFVESETPQPLGTRVDLQFQLPGSDEPVQVRGSVVRTSAGSPASPPGMGIEFDELDSRDAHSAINELVRRLRSPKRHEPLADRPRMRAPRQNGMSSLAGGADDSRCGRRPRRPRRPCAPVRGPPRKVTFCATISVVERFWPSLSSHSRVWRRPSM